MNTLTAKTLSQLLAATAVATLLLSACGGDGTPDSPVTPITPTDTTATTEPTDTTAQQQAAAIGWPEAYRGVMLQAFYWDSYADTRWTELTAQADELAQTFSLLWVPNSGKTSDYYHAGRQTMGYDPCFWLDHTSAWGTEAELRQMIQTFQKKGTGIIEDVVINHKNGLTTWVDFPDEKQSTYTVTWDNQTFSAICRNDECNKNGYTTTGANDTGDNFDGYRDLDHTNAQVQQNVVTYLNYLLQSLGYAGFRYDMVKGYAPRYTGQYNRATQPAFSVGEYWDGSKAKVITWLNGTKHNGQIQSAAFDFPLKYLINDAFAAGAWSKLVQPSLASDPTYQRYAVTFVDNHDTYRESSRLTANICAANAYILCMPGTPCLFYRHWQQYKGTLKRLVALRRAAGIDSQSQIVDARATAAGFQLTVKGEAGQVYLLIGDATATLPDGGRLAVEGHNFSVYADTTISLATVEAIHDTDADPEGYAPSGVPDFCTVADGETCAFFEAPTTWGDIYCWHWDNQYNYTTNKWPGTSCTLVGTTEGGRKVWKWTLDATQRVAQASTNQGIIFSDGTNQTADLPFQNGGYYTQDGLHTTVK